MRLRELTKTGLTAGMLCFSLAAFNASAAVSEAEAAKLGDTLTRIGAEKAGNGGAIPAWTGEKTPAPAGFDGDNYITPFPDEKPVLTITNQNADQYKDQLSAGQMAMLKKYPGEYIINVYPTHRNAVFEERVYEAAVKNATKVSLTESKNGITEYDTSVPFPILHGTDSEKGIQVIFNHITRWRAGSLSRRITQMTPLANGSFTPVEFVEDLSYVTELTDFDPKTVDPNILFYFKQEITSPSRLAGNVLLVHETLDQVKEPRRAWIYNEGQRRVRRAPQVAYDGPGTASDGLRTTDNFDMFSGAPDRYDWKYLGKREMYIPYNSYGLMDKNKSYSDIIKAGHLNQDLARYELHRVHVIEGNVKPGARHIYAKRVMYVDEDTWQIALVDQYDGRGELWRSSEGHATYYYDVMVPWYTAEVIYDLVSGRYLVLGLNNEIKNAYQWGNKQSSNEFTPSALRRSGRR